MSKLSCLALASGLAAALLACPKPPPPAVIKPPPLPTRMLPEDGVQLGLDYCRNQGFTCEVKEVVFLPMNAVKVNMLVSAPMRGSVSLEYDAVSHQLMGINQALSAR